MRRILPLLLLSACAPTSGGRHDDDPDGAGPRTGRDASRDARATDLGDAGADLGASDMVARDMARDAFVPPPDMLPDVTVCAPGQPACADRRTRSVCNPDGMGFEIGEACPGGAACRGGACVSECTLRGKDPTYIGCTYWSVDLDNYPDPFGDPSAVPHAVVVANPSSELARVTVSTRANVRLAADAFEVPPGEVRVYTFPRLDVDGTGITNHSFKLEASWPVVVYQFNPLNNEGVASNDASLLLPAGTLGREYLVMSWPTVPIPPQFGLPPQHGYLTVVATSQGTTTVTVEPSALVEPGGEIPALAAGAAHEFELEQFEVLNLEADGSNLFAVQDLTGSIVTANQPVAVFGGHEEATVGDGCCAEHLEQQMFPVETLGAHYLAARAETREGPGDVWRILAARDGTSVSTVPPQPGAGMVVLGRGEWVEIDTADSFEIVADAPVLVGQYLRSQEDTGDFIGDPALILAVPVAQFRSDYVILTPADYQEDWLTVVRPVGATVELDGAPLADAAFVAFGTGDFEMAWIAVEDGPHTVLGDAPFGLSAYGYSGAVSYGFPAGLDLRTGR